MHARSILFSLTVALMTGCAGQPDSTPVPSEHPASAAAAETPIPPASQTLALSETSPGTTAGDSATLYTCPHHPEVVSDEPGTCPKCHMKLRPTDAPSAAPASAPSDHGDHNTAHEGHGGHGETHP